MKIAQVIVLAILQFTLSASLALADDKTIEAAKATASNEQAEKPSTGEFKDTSTAGTKSTTGSALVTAEKSSVDANRSAGAVFGQLPKIESGDRLGVKRSDGTYYPTFYRMTEAFRTPFPTGETMKNLESTQNTTVLYGPYDAETNF